MTIPEAIATAAKDAEISLTELAAMAGRTEMSARAWVKGTSNPSAETLEVLRRRLPGLKTLLDRRLID